MKKIFIAIAAVAAMTLASCGGQTAQGGDNDSTAIDSTVVEETGVNEAVTEAEAVVSSLADQLKAGNSEGLQSKIEEIKAYITELANNGKLEAAQAYAEKVQKFLDENKAQIDEYTNGAASKVAAALASAGGIKEVASSLLNDVNTKANDAVEDAKNTATKAVEDAKAAAEAKANEAVENAKSKAYEEGKKAGEAAKAKVNEAVDKAANDLKKNLGI